MARHLKRAVGAYSTRQKTENALFELKNAGFDMKNVSVIAKGAQHEGSIAGARVKDREGREPGEGAGAGATTGTILGGVGGLLVGLGTLAVPGVGPILALGTVATTIASTAAGAGIGAVGGGLIGALAGLGIPKDRAKVYSDLISGGDYIVMIDGTQDELRRASAILNKSDVRELEIYDRPPETPPETTAEESHQQSQSNS